MIKRNIKETVREYDSDGRLVRETVTETNEEDFTTLTTTTNSWWVDTAKAVPSEFLNPSSICTTSTEGTTVLARLHS